MTDRQMLRLEACRLAIAACSRDLPVDDRVSEINGWMVFFERLIAQAPADDPPAASDDYPKI